MSKIELPAVTGNNNISRINDNFKKIEDALNQEVLYRTSYVGEPNEMQTNLDMNGNRILNISIGSSPNDLATRGYVDQEISEAVAYTDQQISEERDYVDQNLAPINADLANKYDKAGGPMSGDILMNGHSIYGVDLITSSKVSTTTLEVGGVQVVPTNLAIDPYNGTREALRRSYAEAGYNLVAGSFEAGGTVSTATDALLFEAGGKAYSWGGALPKTVPVGSTPSNSGGTGASAWVDAATGYSFASDIKALLTIPISNSIVTVGGYHIGSKIGGGEFRYDAAMPKSKHNGGTIISRTVPWDGTQAGLSNFLNKVGETDPAGSGCWVRDHGYEVFVSWFGAKCDAVRPTNGIPDGDITGTNDTEAVKKCRDYIQEINFQPNRFVGFWGGYELSLEPNKAIWVKGDNPFGSSRPRDTGSGSAGALARQNWKINGHGALVLWEVTTADDCFIESHEAFTVQNYSDFSVLVCKAVGKMGIFYSNVANDGRNACTDHLFTNVQVSHIMQADPTHGLKYMFRYIGTNNGEGLKTINCNFRQAHTMFYSENLEAVGQAFSKTSFVSYLDNAIMFHLRRHGAGFTFNDGCGILIKGDNATMLRTEYLPGHESGSSGGNVNISFNDTRIEHSTGKTQTLVNADFGEIDIHGVSNVIGGVPLASSKWIMTRKSAVCRLHNCHIVSGVSVGVAGNSTLRRNYGIKFINCKFSIDIHANMFLEMANGSFLNFREAIFYGDTFIESPCIIIEGTDDFTANWQGITGPSQPIMFNAQFHANGGSNNELVPHKAMVGKFSKNYKAYQLNSTKHIILPPYHTIVSAKITHKNTLNADRVEIKIGSAVISYTIPASPVHGLELLPGKAIVISDNNLAERTVETTCYLGANVVPTPSWESFIILEYRPAFGSIELTETETGGVRLTRVVS